MLVRELVNPDVRQEVITKQNSGVSPLDLNQDLFVVWH